MTWGKHWRGSGQPHGNALLDVSIVKEIRELEGHMSARETAELFNVGKNTVLDIWRGRTWRNV
jgi:hypothetical protein